MGTYNPQKDKIRSAIESIRNQTISSWELLICDDGSDETKYREIQKLCRMDARIKCFRYNKNQGLAHALNECLRYAEGTYIARMDDDDVSLQKRLEKQADFLDNHSEYAWVGCAAELFDNTGIWGEASRPEVPERSDFLHSSPFVHPSVMFRKTILMDGYCENKFTSRCEDYELFMRLYSKGWKGYNLQEILFQYREDSRYLKRAMKYCVYEMIIRIQGFRKLGLLSVRNIPYVIKPILVGIISKWPSVAQKIRTIGMVGDHVVKSNEKR